MKKHIISTISILIVLLLCACNSTISSGNNDIDLDRIFEVGEQYANELNFNHKNIISTLIVQSTDNTALSERKILLDGVEHSIKYKDTIYYLMGEKRVHRYFVNENEDNTVLIDAEGNIQSILYKYTYLDIAQNASPDEVFELLKPELDKIFDLSFYKNVDIPKYDQHKTRFKLYDYKFYNTLNGYITDYLIVSVADDGGVFGIKQHNLAAKDFTLDINKEKEKAAIEAKLKDIYNTDSTEYLSFESYNTPRITIYENQICVKYNVSADFLRKKQGTSMSGFVIALLIPLDLIST